MDRTGGPYQRNQTTDNKRRAEEKKLSKIVTIYSRILVIKYLHGKGNEEKRNHVANYC